MDTGIQKYINKDIINKIRDLEEQIEQIYNNLNHIDWRIINIQPYESLRVLKRVKLDIKNRLKLRIKELKELQEKLIIC